MKITDYLWSIILSDSLKNAIEAFKQGECFYCDYKDKPSACDMVRDESCRMNLFNKLCQALKAFKYTVKHKMLWQERMFELTEKENDN